MIFGDDSPDLNHGNRANVIIISLMKTSFAANRLIKQPRGMMEVKVKLFATLGQYAPHGKSAKPFVIDVEENTSVKALVDKLDIPKDSVHLKFVNGRARDADYELQPGDEVGFFPPIGGG